MHETPNYLFFPKKTNIYPFLLSLLLDLTSVWQESATRNKSLLNGDKKSVNKANHHQQQQPHHRTATCQGNNKSSTTTTTTTNTAKQTSNYSNKNGVKNFAILKSKTDASIPDWLPYLYHDRFTDNRQEVIHSSKNDINSAYQKASCMAKSEPENILSNNKCSSNTVEIKAKESSQRIKPSVIDVKSKLKETDYSDSQANNCSSHKNDTKQSLPFIQLLATSPSSSSTCSTSSSESKENYSKIPVLSARVIAANSPFKGNLNTQNGINNKPNYVSGYSGSFTEKLLSRCRSSPTIPMIGDSLNRWSSSRMQLSSPNKVLSITQAINSHNNNSSSSISSSQSKRSPLSISNKFTPFKSINQLKNINNASAINSSSLPYADVNEADNE